MSSSVRSETSRPTGSIGIQDLFGWRHLKYGLELVEESGDISSDVANDCGMFGSMNSMMKESNSCKDGKTRKE